MEIVVGGFEYVRPFELFPEPSAPGDCLADRYDDLAPILVRELCGFFGLADFGSIGGGGLHALSPCDLLEGALAATNISFGKGLGSRRQLLRDGGLLCRLLLLRPSLADCVDGVLG